MRKSLILAATLFTFALTAAIGPNTSHAATTCENLLANNVYRCHMKTINPDSGDEIDFDDCFRFSSPGTLSSHFDLSVDLLEIPQGCDCSATGSFKNPKFSASKEFHCTTDTSGSGYGFRGKVVGNKIQKGQAIGSSGDSYVYECDLVSACAVSPAPALTTPGAANPYKR